MIMKVAAEVLRDLDPRKSYDRGAWVAPDSSQDQRPGLSNRIGTTVNVNFAKLSTVDLHRELERRQKSLEQLQNRRQQLRQELAAVDQQIAELGGTTDAPETRARPASSRQGRELPRNSVNLPDAIAMAVEVGATVSPTEAAELVRKNGYVTTAKNFGQIVAQALAKDGRFKRLERGQYERVK